MNALVLAAGYAVRLRPLTLNTPKPLLAVGKKTMIDRLIEKIISLEEIDKIYIITNAKFFEVFEGWRRKLSFKDKVSVINDGTLTNETRLGAIKDLDLVIKEKKIAEDLLVIAGDNLFEFELGSFLKFARSHPSDISIALFDIKDIASAKRFGVVSVDEKGKIINFEEKPASPLSTLVSTGVYYFPKNALSLVREYLGTPGGKKDAPGYYIGWLALRGAVYGFRFEEDWYDIGDMDCYNRVNKIYTEKER